MEQFDVLHGKKIHIHNLYYAGFYTLMGPISVFILLWTNSPDSERLLCRYSQCHILYKTLIHFLDSSSSPWTERRGRSYICGYQQHFQPSTDNRNSCAHNPNSKHKAPIHRTFLLHFHPSDCTSCLHLMNLKNTSLLLSIST